MRAVGITGHSGAGKTTLLVRLIPLFTARGLRVATIKHAHSGFDLDIPGKDSYEHRKAGASAGCHFFGKAHRPNTRAHRGRVRTDLSDSFAPTGRQ